MAKAHKNADFVLGDGCREPSSAHWSSALPATSPAGCIWQQCARQQIAATYHATCRRACCRELPRATYRRGATAEELPQKATAGTPIATQPAAKTYLPGILPCIPPDNLPAVHAAATCRQALPAAHTTVHTPGQPTCRAYYRAMGPTARWGQRPAGG